MSLKRSTSWTKDRAVYAAIWQEQITFYDDDQDDDEDDDHDDDDYDDDGDDDNDDDDYDDDDDDDERIKHNL